MASGRNALAVMRCQPVTKGHTWLVNHMIGDFDNATVGLGSTGRHNEPGHPWTQVDRRVMLSNVYGNRIKVMYLQDIGAEQSSNEWCEHVLNVGENLKMPEVTDYFTGSHADAMWYKGMFWEGDPESKLLASPEYEAKYFTKSGVLRRLHIVERSDTVYPSATEVRTFLATRSDQWKQWVPAVNHQLIEETYPERFKVHI